MAAEVFGTGRLEDCVVHDISATGARLTMASTSFIPDTFDLSFDGVRTLRLCRVVWRTATEVGVRFEGKAFRRASRSDDVLFASPSPRRLVRAANRRQPILVSVKNTI